MFFSFRKNLFSVPLKVDRYKITISDIAILHLFGKLIKFARVLEKMRGSQCRRNNLETIKEYDKESLCYGTQAPWNAFLAPSGFNVDGKWRH